jgi:SHS2 domain-containing protein
VSRTERSLADLPRDVPDRVAARGGPSTREPSGWAGRVATLIASGALVAAVFLPWDTDGRTAVEVGLRSFGDHSEQPTVGVTLVVLAALAALPALVSDAGLPRLLAAVLAGGLVLSWLAWGPDGALAAGVLAALIGAVLLLVGAAVANGGIPGGRSTATTGPASSAADPVGHEHLDHTADSAFRAWGRTRAECFAAAVRALVDSFADPDGARPSGTCPLTLPPADDEDLLVDLLSEVIYLLEVRRAVPIGGEVRNTAEGGLEVTFDLVPVEEVQLTGAVPKAITYHDLKIGRIADGVWECRVTIDV